MAYPRSACAPRASAASLPPMPAPVLIDGLGLMGSSLAAALTQVGRSVLLLHRRPEVAAEAERRGWGRAITDPAEAAGVELAMVCTPVDAIPAEVRRLVHAGVALVTDVGSTKASLVHALEDLGGAYVGSHPMCGSHLQGLAHADSAHLYRVPPRRSPRPRTTPEALARVSALWTAVGCRLLCLEPQEEARPRGRRGHPICRICSPAPPPRS